MKILLFGGDGQLGTQLRRSLAVLGDVVAPARAGESPSGDLRRPRDVAAAITSAAPDVVVNAAAWTDVDGAERDPAAAQAVNAVAVDVMARACSAAGSWFVHVSTDYVYDGTGERPWREDDVPRPLSAYGRGKLEGDRAAMAGTPRHLVLRTGWLFEPGYRNFVTAILRAAADGEAIDVVDDQWGAPTRAALVADVLAHMLAKVRTHEHPGSLAGLYHVAAAGSASRLQCATLAIEAGHAARLPLRVRADQLRPGKSGTAPGRAARPLNCRLDTTKLRQAFGLHLPPWQDGVRDAVAGLARATRWRST